MRTADLPGCEAALNIKAAGPVPLSCPGMLPVSNGTSDRHRGAQWPSLEGKGLDTSRSTPTKITRAAPPALKSWFTHVCSQLLAVSEGKKSAELCMTWLVESQETEKNPHPVCLSRPRGLCSAASGLSKRFQPVTPPPHCQKPQEREGPSCVQWLGLQIS